MFPSPARSCPYSLSTFVDKLLHVLLHRHLDIFLMQAGCNSLILCSLASMGTGALVFFSLLISSSQLNDFVALFYGREITLLGFMEQE